MAKVNRVLIDGQWFAVSAKTGRPSKIPLTRCSNTMTETDYQGWVLSGLRALTHKWLPAQQAWKLNTRPNQSGSRHKVEHECQHCKQWFVKTKIKGKKRNTVELDHIKPIGGYSGSKSLDLWAANAFVELEQYQKLCYACHTFKTNSEKVKKND